MEQRLASMERTLNGIAKSHAAIQVTQAKLEGSYDALEVGGL